MKKRIFNLGLVVFLLGLTCISFIHLNSLISINQFKFSFLINLYIISNLPFIKIDINFNLLSLGVLN